jgi:hypothetical protein
MTTGHSFAQWSWGDPAECTRRSDAASADPARCEKLEPLATGPSYTRRRLRDLGLTGVEVAAFRTRMRTVPAPAPPMPARPASMLNQIFYFFGHRWIYDVDELRYALSPAGCDPVAGPVRACGVGERPDIAALDLPVRDDETIYIEVSG